MVLRFGTNFLRQALRPADPLASLGFTATVRAGVRLPHRQIELEPVHRGINGVGVGVDAALGDAGGDGGGGRGDGVRGGGRGDGADGHVRAGGSASTLDLVELLNTGELMLLAWGPAIIEFPDVDEWNERIVLVTVADPDDTDCATNHRSQIADNSTVTAQSPHRYSTSTAHAQHGPPITDYSGPTPVRAGHRHRRLRARWTEVGDHVAGGFASEGGLALVRPDRMTAWCSVGNPDAAAQGRLRNVLAGMCTVPDPRPGLP